MKPEHRYITENLSEKQLLSLYYNSKLNSEIKKRVRDEIERRSLTDDYLNKMKATSDIDPISVFSPLERWQKMLIVLFPISPYIIFWDIYGGNVKRISGHWKYVTLGFLFWTIMLLSVLIITGKKLQ